MIKSEIDGVAVEMTVEETIGSELGGYPILWIGLKKCMVAEPDTLEVYKAVATSGTVEEFCERVNGCWSGQKYSYTIKACALEHLDGHGIIEDTEHNDQILNEIHRLDKIFRKLSVDDEYNRLTILAKVYDLQKELECF